MRVRITNESNRRNKPAHHAEKETDEPHPDGEGGHIGVIDVGYGSTDLWVGTVFVFDTIKVEFHSGSVEASGEEQKPRRKGRGRGGAERRTLWNRPGSLLPSCWE